LLTPLASLVELNTGRNLTGQAISIDGPEE